MINDPVGSPFSCSCCVQKQCLTLWVHFNTFHDNKDEKIMTKLTTTPQVTNNSMTSWIIIWKHLTTSCYFIILCFFGIIQIVINCTLNCIKCNRSICICVVAAVAVVAVVKLVQSHYFLTHWSSLKKKKKKYWFDQWPR